MDAMPLNLARPEVPIELAALVARMMAKEPERRFQTPSDVAQALTPFFRKGGEALKVSKPEVSQTGQNGTRTSTVGPSSLPSDPPQNAGTTTAPWKGKPAGTARPAAVWESLVDTGRSGLDRADAPRVSKTRRPRWVWPSVAAGVLAIGLIVALALGVFKIKTKDGVIVLENVPADAVVEVDGDKMTITPAEGERLKVSVQPGKHGVVVKRGNDVLMGESVTLESGKSQTLKVRLIPVNQSEPGPRSVAVVEVSARTKAILDALEKPVAMNFRDETPLEDVLKYVKELTKGSIKSGVPIYVDPIGLQEAEKSMTSTIRNIDLKDLPLSTTLPLALEQLDLTYCVKDDMLIITSKESADVIRKESPTVVGDQSPRNKVILEMLEMPIPMSFNDETPLEDVLDYVKTAAKKGETDLANRIYVDPNGLQEAERAMTSTIRGLEVEDVPLKTTLRLMLKQLDLGFVVKGGMLVITSLESLEEKPDEPENAAEKQGPVEPERLQENSEKPANAGELAGNAEREGFVPLFNGKDLAGWANPFQNGSEWKVTDGILEGRGDGEGSPAFLVTQRANFANFRLRIKYRYEKDGSGNLEIRRSTVGANRSGYKIHHGVWPNAQPGEFPVGSVLKMSNEPYGPVESAENKMAESVPTPLNEWNNLDVTALRNRVTVAVNGRRVAEYTDASGWYAAGAIAVSAWPKSVVQFQEILIEELPE